MNGTIDARDVAGLEPQMMSIITMILPKIQASL